MSKWRQYGNLLCVLLLVSCARPPEEDVPLSRIIRINPDTDDIELAIKKFRSSNFSTAVTILPMMHFAEKSFYDYVNQMITNKAVLYENIFYTYEEWKVIQERVKKLPPPYPSRFLMINKVSYDYYAEHFRFEKQLDSVNYDLCQEAIHADVASSPEQKRKLLEGTDKDLMKEVDDWVANKIRRYENSESDIDKNLAQIDAFQKSHVTNLRDFFGLNKLSIQSNEHINTEFYNQVVLSRDKIVQDILAQTLKRKDPPREIVIVYGYLHMVSIEKYLSELDFVPSDGDIAWIKVLNLGR